MPTKTSTLCMQVFHVLPRPRKGIREVREPESRYPDGVIEAVAASCGFRRRRAAASRMRAHGPGGFSGAGGRGGPGLRDKAGLLGGWQLRELRCRVLGSGP